MPAPAELHIGIELTDLARLHPWLDIAGATWTLPKRLLDRMHIALEEAVMNVAMHALTPGVAREIGVRLHASPEAAVLIIDDNGQVFDPTRVAAAARPANLNEASPGGLGLTLLRHYCTDISYERVGGRNRLTLRFPRDGASGAREH